VAAASKRARVLVLGVVAPLVVFALLAWGVVDGGFRWDGAVLEFFERRYDLDVAEPLGDLARLGLVAVAALGVGMLAFLLARRPRREAVFWSLALGGVVVFDPLLKATFRRPGIPPSDEFSFPSGHAMVTLAALAALVALVASQRKRRLLVIAGGALVLANGVVIVFLWWHHPSDVLAGWCWALAWVCALRLILPAGGQAQAFTRIRA
jgi:membrane-associated phospholipid phosphatase